MGNPFYGGIGNLGMRPMGQPTVPQVNVPTFTPQPVNRGYNNYTIPTPTAVQAPAPVMPVNNAVNAIQAITPQSNMIWIDSPDEITNYPSGRGWQQWFGNKNEPVVYIRETDSNGVIQPVVTVWLDFKGPASSEQASAAPAEEPKAAVSASTTPAAAPAQTASSGPSREEFDALVSVSRQTSSNVAELAKSIAPVLGKLEDFLKT